MPPRVRDTLLGKITSTPQIDCLKIYIEKYITIPLLPDLQYLLVSLQHYNQNSHKNYIQELPVVLGRGLRFWDYFSKNYNIRFINTYHEPQ